MDEGEAAAVWVHQWLNRDELWPLSAALSVTDTASRAASSVISGSHGSLGLGSFLRGGRGSGGVGGWRRCEAAAPPHLHFIIWLLPKRSCPLTLLPLLPCDHFSSYGPSSIHPSIRPSVSPSHHRPPTNAVFGLNSLPSFFLPFSPALFFSPLAATAEPMGSHLQSCLSFHGLWKWMFYCLH